MSNPNYKSNWTATEIKYLFAMEYLFTDFLVEKPYVKWYTDVCNRFLPNRSEDAIKIKLSRMKQQDNVENVENISNEIEAIVQYCRGKDCAIPKFASMLEETSEYSNNLKGLVSYCVGKMDTPQMKALLGNSRYYNQLWDQTTDTSTRLLNCLILRVIHLISFKEDSVKYCKDFNLANQIYKGFLTVGDLMIKFPQFLKLSRLEFHEELVHNIKEWTRSYPIHYDFINALRRKCIEVTGFNSSIVNPKVEFFVRESMKKPVQRIQIGELSTPCTVFMLVQRVNQNGERIGRWEEVQIKSIECKASEIVSLDTAKHLGDGTFSKWTKFLCQERIGKIDTQENFYINTPLKCSKITSNVFNRIENWNVIKKEMNKTHLHFTSELKQARFRHDFRFSSLKVPLRGDNFDFFRKIKEYFNSRGVEHVTMEHYKGAFLIFGVLMGDGTAADCALTLSDNELELVKWIVNFMKPLTKKGQEPYYNLIFSKKVIKDGFEEFETDFIPFGGPNNIPTLEKQKISDQFFEEGFLPSCYDVRYPGTEFNKLMHDLGLYEKDINHATRVFKKIPKWMYDIPTVFANEYLTGMIYSDGHMRKKGRSMTFGQVDQHVMDHMIFMGVQCGYIVYPYSTLYDNDRIDLSVSFTGLSILGFDGHSLKKKMYAHQDRAPLYWRKKLGKETKWKVKSMVEIKVDLKDSKSVLIPTSRGYNLVIGNDVNMSTFVQGNLDGTNRLSNSLIYDEFTKCLSGNINHVLQMMGKRERKQQ